MWITHIYWYFNMVSNKLMKSEEFTSYELCFSENIDSVLAFFAKLYFS